MKQKKAEPEDLLAAVAEAADDGFLPASDSPYVSRSSATATSCGCGAGLCEEGFYSSGVDPTGRPIWP